MEHVVIQDPKQTFGDLLNLDILCRCRVTKHPPYEKVNIGDIVYIQNKDGAIVVKYAVSSVVSTPFRDPEEIRKLCKNSSLFDANDYWKAQQGRNYGTIVWLTNPEQIFPPIKRKVARGNDNDWIILDSKEKKRGWSGL